MEYIDFETGFMRDIKNNTYVTLYCRIIEMLERANFQHPHLIDSIGLLKRHDITLTVYKPESKHYLTPKIQKLHKERRKRLASLRDIIDRISSIKGYVSADTAKLLQSFLKPLRIKIGSRNVSDEKLAVSDIEISLMNYYYLKLALEKANLISFIEELIILNNEIIELEENREDDNLSSSLGNDRKIRSYKDLNMVLMVLNSVIELGKQDSKLAAEVGDNINRELRRERGYVRMVNTKKQQKKELEQYEEE